MQYYSTNKSAATVRLPYAVLKGLADDGGLYMPESIPQLPASFFETIHTKTLPEIGYAVASALIGDEVPADVLKKIVEETLNFPIPAVRVENDIYSLELFHGPTMAFKDVGARFMSRLMAYFNQNESRELKVIVATSGDTGSAVAAGFYNVPGIKVYILFPKGKVSPLQQKQLTTWGGNITAIEIDGTFDDCQKMAKQALGDAELNKNNLLTSANSINIARLIPQSFYYFWAFAQLREKGKPLVFCVPSGNFGNITGGLLAAAMGLPVHHFIATTNANDVVPEYLRTSVYKTRPSVQTISNAMDVGNPSNYARMCELFDHNHQRFCEKISGYAFSDEETRKAMVSVKAQGYLLDPHGAVAYLGLKEYLRESKAEATGVFLETAHPAKFREVVEETLGEAVEIPQQLQAFIAKQEQIIHLPNDYEQLKNMIDR
ncbi:threonine synthase [Cesiribacter sp. SM1]|uniref:threonine synthase n=1 Tax=Cesiribacter sp. SM1 TaxID=2861196 RepID=UPI001CD7B17F|nr:threonine synthase [Cesiribacter sp. SM1]